MRGHVAMAVSSRESDLGSERRAASTTGTAHLRGEEASWGGGDGGALLGTCMPDPWFAFLARCMHGSSAAVNFQPSRCCRGQARRPVCHGSASPGRCQAHSAGSVEEAQKCYCCCCCCCCYGCGCGWPCRRELVWRRVPSAVQLRKPYGPIRTCLALGLGVEVLARRLRRRGEPAATTPPRHRGRRWASPYDGAWLEQVAARPERGPGG